MSDLATTFVAHLTTPSGKISITIGLDDSQRRIWGYYDSVPWMIISGYISKGTTTQSRTVDGELVIINWSNVVFVTYDNPWEHISSADAIKG